MNVITVAAIAKIDQYKCNKCLVMIYFDLVLNGNILDSNV